MKYSTNFHRAQVPILKAKYVGHHNYEYHIEYVKGYIIETDLPFTVYAQKMNEKRHSKWTINVGGKSSFFYDTLKELKANAFLYWSSSHFERALQADILFNTILEFLPNSTAVFTQKEMNRITEIAAEKWVTKRGELHWTIST